MPQDSPIGDVGIDVNRPSALVTLQRVGLADLALPFTPVTTRLNEKARGEFVTPLSRVA